MQQQQFYCEHLERKNILVGLKSIKITHSVFQTKAESLIHNPELGYETFHQKLES